MWVKASVAPAVLGTKPKGTSGLEWNLNESTAMTGPRHSPDMHRRLEMGCAASLVAGTKVLLVAIGSGSLGHRQLAQQGSHINRR